MARTLYGETNSISDGRWMRPIEGFLYVDDVGQPFLAKHIFRPQNERLCHVMHQGWTLHFASIDPQIFECAIRVLGYYSKSITGTRALRKDVTDKGTRNLCKGMREQGLMEVNGYISQDPYIAMIKNICNE